ncbi:MAG: hypothetical protein WAO41_04210 [Candidatus Nanopelagicales bacterium]
MGRRRPARPKSSPVRTPDPIEEHPDGDYVVRRLTGSASTKPYRCPGCDQLIQPATPHVVTWPVDRGSQDRRHWHTVCWQARHRRGPRS